MGNYRGSAQKAKALEKYRASKPKCPECAKTIPYNRGEWKRQKFCSRVCAAVFNGKHRPSVPKKDSNICSCGAYIPGTRTTRCKDCLTKEQEEHAKTRAIKDMFCRGASRAKFNSVRHWARKLMDRSDRAKVCQYPGCGFDVRVDVCHIKAIASFSEDTTMGVVNDLENLIYLCPNHHAMLDMGLLENL